MARPGDDYFESYGQSGQPYSRAMARSVINSRNLLSAWQALIEENLGRSAQARYAIDSFLDVGAADGRLVRQFARSCSQSLGLECARWPREHLHRSLRSRVLFGDFVALSRQFADDAFDLVLDSSAMYADDLDEWRHCLREVRRICRVGAMFYYYAQGAQADAGPQEIRGFDRYATILPSREAWLRAVLEAGFDLVAPRTFVGRRYQFDLLLAIKLAPRDQALRRRL